MRSIFRSPHFVRKAHKLIRKNPLLETTLTQRIRLLLHDPFTPSLRTHPIIARIDGKKAMSSFVTSDLRMIWRFDGEQMCLINLIDFGGHSGGGKVYR